MTRTTVVAGVVALALSMPLAQAQGAARYRDFQLGSDMAAISAQLGVSATQARLVHTRPSLMQDLEWRRPYSAVEGAATDPVQQITFGFVDNQLFRMVIDYERARTEGLTDADMIETISAVYGAPAKAPLKALAPSALDDDSGKVLARWTDGDFSAVLHRMTYASGVRLIVTSARLDALARKAAAQAMRLDVLEAPQRDIARQKLEAATAVAAKEKARLANKAVFKP